MRSRLALALFTLVGLFALFSTSLIAQDLAKSPQASPATPSEAPSLVPASSEPAPPEPAAPLWLTTWCSQYDHGSCHFYPEPRFPNDCCRSSSISCPSFCLFEAEE